jgi:hypothetical protein
LFGYIVTNPEALGQERQQRFKAMYCGLCRTLRKRHGFLTSATLSYDLAFLALLLNALYEPGERTARERCIANPAKQHDYVSTPVMDYVSDMNIALAYHKCMDDWFDDKNPLSAGQAGLLRKAYRSVEKAYPTRCAAIENWLRQIHGWEKDRVLEIDLPVNATGRMLAELFVWPEQDAFAGELRAIGDGLGRFVYFMDAYDDLPGDVRRGNYNPLKALMDREDYEQLCKSALMMMIADAADAFERLPILLDADIIRNVLYSGVWSKYAFLQSKRGAQNKGA